MTWNPSTPTAFGMEWPVTKQVAYTLGADGTAIAPRVTSSISEDIDYETVFLQAASGSPFALMEVHEESIARYAGSGRSGYRASVPWALPNADVAAGSWTASAGTLSSCIDDGAAYSEADYITATGPTAFSVRLNTLVTPSGGPMWSGRKIIGFGVSWYAASPGYPFSGGNLTPHLTISGGDYVGNPQYVAANTSVGSPSSVSYWSSNPRTGLPWSIADIERFATADAFGLSWTGAWGTYIASTVRVFAVYPFVTWVDETRSAITTAPVVPPAAPAWTIFPLSTPDYHNMLTPQQASLEAVGTSGWVGLQNCALTRSTVTFDTGVASLRLTSSAAGAMQAGLGNDSLESPRVIAGRVIAFRARTRPITVGRQCRVSISWVDENGVSLQTDDGPLVLSVLGVYTSLTVTATAPVNAAHAYGYITVLATAAAGEAHEFDGMMMTPEVVPAAFLAGGGSLGFWRKVSGKNYVQTLRRWNSSGTISIPGLTTDSPPCPNGWANYNAPLMKTIQGRGDGGVIDFPGSITQDVPGVLLTTIAAAYSVDSQPYVAFGPGAGNVHSANTIQQEFTAPANATLAIQQLILSLADETGSGFGDLLVKIKRRADNVQFGGTATITAASMVTTGRSVTVPRVVMSTLASAAVLVAGTQYYWEISSPATVSPKKWILGGVLYTNGALGGNATGFGGIVDNYTDPALGAERQDMDLYAVLSTQPAAVGSFTATNASPAGTAIKAIRLAWTAPVPPTGFSSYEIWRDDQDGDGYRRIAVITNVATLTYDDPHAELNAPTLYEIRWIRSDGAGSAFRTLAAPVTRTGSGCKYELVRAGVDPALWIQADDAWADGERAYEIDDGDPTSDELYDDDARFSSRRTERYGDRFTIHLGLYGGNQSPIPSSATRGRRSFDLIYALMNAATDYVVVHDSDGNRWYATIRLSNPRVRQPGDFVAIDAEVTEQDPGFVEEV